MITFVIIALKMFVNAGRHRAAEDLYGVFLISPKEGIMKTKRLFRSGTTDTQTIRARRTRGTRQHLEHAIAATPVGIELLECRRMLSVAINGSVTLDESPGLQTGGVVVGGEDNNDSD